MIKHRSATALLAACGMALAVPAVGFAQDDGQTSPSPGPSSTSGTPSFQYPFVAVSPQKSMAGEDVLVSVGCPVEDLGEVKSLVLDHLGKFVVTSENPVIQGAVAQIGAKAKPGFYSVKATCGKLTVTAHLEVTPPRTPTSTSRPPKATPAKPRSVKAQSGRQVSRVPVGAPQTGGGTPR